MAKDWRASSRSPASISGCVLDEVELGGGARQPGGREGVARGGRVQRAPGAGLCRGDAGALEGQRPLARGAAELGVEAGDERPEGGLVDDHLGLEVVAAGEVVPEPDGVPALLATGLGDGRRVVDLESRLDGLDGDGGAVDGGLDRGADLLGQPGPEAVGRLGLRVATDAHAADGRAPRHLVAGGVVRRDVEPPEDDEEAEQQPEHDTAAGLVLGGRAGVDIGGGEKRHAPHPRSGSVNPRDRRATRE